MKVTRPPLPPVTTLATTRPAAAATGNGTGATGRASSAPAAHAPGLAQVANRLAQSSEIDLTKVAAVRDAIASGRLTLDMDRLAEAVLEMHRR